MPERSEPARHSSHCSRSRLESLDEIMDSIAPGRVQPAHAQVLMNSCDELPPAFRTWLEPFAKGDRPPAMADVDGMEALVRKACAPGISVIEETSDRAWRARMAAMYERCQFEALDFVGRESFVGSTGPRTAVVAMTLYRWMVADGVALELAKTFTRRFAGFGERPFYGVSGDLLADMPSYRAPGSTSELGPDRVPTRVVGPENLWLDGEKVVEIPESMRGNAVEKHFDEVRASLEGERFPPLQLAPAAGTSYGALTRVMYGAGMTGFTRIKLVVGRRSDLDESGRTLEADEWTPSLSVINVALPPIKKGAGLGRKPPDFRLTVGVESDGIRVMDTGEMVPPKGDCDEPGPTICLRNPDADSPVDRHDWAALYETIAKIHADHPNETVISVSADPSLPVGVVIRLIDVVRYERRTPDGTPLADRETITRKMLRNSEPRTRNGNIPRRMFSDPILAVVGP